MPKKPRTKGLTSEEPKRSEKPSALADAALRDNPAASDGIPLQEQVREAWLQERYLLHSLMDNLPDSIYFKDQDSRFIRISRSMADRCGLKNPAEAIGKTDFDFFTEEHARPAFEDEQEIIKTGQPLLNKIEKETWADGRVRWVSTTKEALRDNHGRIIGTLGISRDVTEQKLAEQALQQAHDELELRVRERTADLVQANDALKIEIQNRQRASEELRVKAAELARSNAERQQFAYVASHDLQEPLRMVASYVQLLERRYKDKLDQDARDFIGFAVDGAKRMKDLINDLLAYSRVGTHGKNLEPLDCEALLAEVLLNLEASIRETGGAVTHDILPTVMADCFQMLQLFQNLVSNGLKFHKDQPPAVHVGVVEDGDDWRFSVRDNGIGIDPQATERIFAIFQRLHTREEYPGTGIGLAICRRIVERHGGRIWVESAPGNGSTFLFTIPKALKT